MRQAPEMPSTGAGASWGSKSTRLPHSLDLGKVARNRSTSRTWLRIDGKHWTQLVWVERSELRSVGPTAPASGTDSTHASMRPRAGPATSVSGFRNKRVFPVECETPRLFARAKPRFVAL